MRQARSSWAGHLCKEHGCVLEAERGGSKQAAGQRWRCHFCMLNDMLGHASRRINLLHKSTATYANLKLPHKRHHERPDALQIAAYLPCHAGRVGHAAQ